MPPLDLADHPELGRMLAAAEQRGRVRLLAEIIRMLHERVGWPGPGVDLFIEMLSGLADREELMASGIGGGSAGDGGPRGRPNGHLPNGGG
jgi:hypothetical protein